MEVATTAGGNTLLHVAVVDGHADLALLLLHRTLHLLVACHAALDTPLHLTAHAGENKAIALLVAMSLSSSSPSSPSLRSLTKVTNKRGEMMLHDTMWGAHEDAVHALATTDPELVGLCGGARDRQWLGPSGWCACS
jgi:ankyrin repeat protein